MPTARPVDVVDAKAGVGAADTAAITAIVKYRMAATDAGFPAPAAANEAAGGRAPATAVK